jgi:hypothetical protein
MLLEPLSMAFVHVTLVLLGAIVVLVVISQSPEDPVASTTKPSSFDVVTLASGFEALRPITGCTEISSCGRGGCQVRTLCMPDGTIVFRSKWETAAVPPGQPGTWSATLTQVPILWN